ncbi:MAG: aldo/keto reductase, partial [Candidatus Binatia bacterium]
SSLGDEPDLVRHARDAGINYFDTAESYTGSVSETTIGKALRGDRQRVILATKTEASAQGRREDFMHALEGSLRRLRTDSVDVYFNHAVNDVARMKNPEWREFTVAAKKQGKIRFAGMSGHAGNLIECLDYALDEKLVDVVLVAYNFGQDPAFYQGFLGSTQMVAVHPELPKVLRRAHADGVGVVAMKTLMGARLNDLRPYEKNGATFAQAAFRWVLSNPDVDALIVTMKSRERIDEYLGASGGLALRDADAPLLVRYAAVNHRAFCRFGCDSCVSSCPSGVDIPEVLHSRMYALDYGDLALGRSAYAKLGRGAEACLSCAVRSCASACPNGLAIERMTAESHRLLAG